MKKDYAKIALDIQHAVEASLELNMIEAESRELPSVESQELESDGGSKCCCCCCC